MTPLDLALSLFVAAFLLFVYGCIRAALEG